MVEKLLKECLFVKNKKVANILFWGCVASPLIAILLTVLLGFINSLFRGNMWVFFLFLPVSVLSVTCGASLKKSQKKYKKNLIAGIVSTVLILSLGSFSLFWKDTYTENDKYIKEAEHIIGVKLPEYSKLATHRVNAKISSGKALYACNVTFEDEEAPDFESHITSDDRWLSTISDSLLFVSSPAFHLESADYTLIYNKTTEQFNTVPEETGKYDFLCMMYNVEKNEMEIVEYKLNIQ